MGCWAKSCKLESCHQGWNRFSILFITLSYFLRIKLIWFYDCWKHTDDEKRLNATYIVSVARKLGCSVFLLPEVIVEVRTKIYNEFSGNYTKQHLPRWDVFGMLWQVNQKMILILTASIMYWSLQRHSSESSDSSSTQSTTTTGTSTDASPAPSVTGEDEVSSLSGEVSSFAVDENDADTVSDITTVSEETVIE